MQGAAATTAAADAATPRVEAVIQRALEYDRSELRLSVAEVDDADPAPLTVTEAQRIIEYLPLFDTLTIGRYPLDNDAAVLNVFCNGLPLCTSITTVNLDEVKLGNEGFEQLLPAFYNTCVRRLSLSGNNIEGQRGGEAIRDLLDGNMTLGELSLDSNTSLGPEGAMPVGKALASSNHNRLQKLNLSFCLIGNEGLKHLVAAAATVAAQVTHNISLTDLRLGFNNIEGVEGAELVGLLLQRFLLLKVLSLDGNHLGPLGARALAPGLAAAACHLESLDLSYCGLGDNGVANFLPNGQVNRSLTNLDLRGNNIGIVGGEHVVALASRSTNLDVLHVERNILSPDQQRRLDLLLDRNRLVNKAQSLAGSTFPILFRAVEEARGHEQGLGAIFVILQNDGDDHFCTANNRAIE